MKDDLTIIRKVVTNITEVDFVNNPTRKRLIVDARMIFGSLARKITNKPYEAIGKFMNKDHASIIHYCSQAEALLETDKEFKHLYNQCVEGLEYISGGNIMVWTRMNYHLRMANQLKKILDNG